MEKEFKNIADVLDFITERLDEMIAEHRMIESLVAVMGKSETFNKKLKEDGMDSKIESMNRQVEYLIATRNLLREKSIEERVVNSIGGTAQ